MIEYKRIRKGKGDRIESALFDILISFYGIKIQAYHGDSLTGKDIQKLMQNSREIFELFAGTLKRMRKSDCSMSDEDIDEWRWDWMWDYVYDTVEPPEEVYTQ